MKRTDCIVPLAVVCLHFPTEVQSFVNTYDHATTTLFEGSFPPSYYQTIEHHTSSKAKARYRGSSSRLFGFLDDLFGKKDEVTKSQDKEDTSLKSFEQQKQMDEDDNDDIQWNESDFRNELQKRGKSTGDSQNGDIKDGGNVVTISNVETEVKESENEEEREFDGYMVSCTI